jgi:hypothetical protein
MDMSGLTRDLGKQDLCRAEDSLLGELDDVSIWEFIAFLFQESFVTEKLVFIVVGDFDVFLLDFLDNFSILNFVFGLKRYRTKN